jgi:hypothetical protein
MASRTDANPLCRRAVGGAVAALGLLVLAGPAAAAPPTDPRCLPLVGGSTGILVAGGSVPTGDSIAGRPGGFGPIATGAVARTLPDRIVFKTSRETFSNEYAFALRDGVLNVRPAVVGVGVAAEPWRRLETPDCLTGAITAISADHRLLIALGTDRQIYAHDMPGGDLSPERWTWRWGPYFWTGVGMRMFEDVQRWATSEFTSAETFRDSSGREQHPIGVATVYLLRGDGRRITYLDPWLPTDESREVCGPRRGTVALASLSASGSTVFVASRRSELFTRIYDFDVSGANTVFGTFTWQQDRPATDTRWQLPGPGWVRQPLPPRRRLVTDRLTIAKTGAKPGDRVLRIEGRTRAGRVGYWEKPIDDLRASAWRFVHTGGGLVGTPLRRTRPAGGATPSSPDDRRYAGTIGTSPAEVLDLHPECSPARLRVSVAPDLALDLLLHTSDGLRQETRAHGLDDTPREYNGAIEVPRATFASLARRDPRLRGWIEANLGGRRITTAPVALTRTRLRFLAQCWELTLDGEPARPDQPRVPPDLGAVVGRQTERQQDGRPPPAC